MAIAVLFPGQGTQTPRMGEPWRAYPVWEIVERAETVPGQPLAHRLLEAHPGRMVALIDTDVGVVEKACAGADTFYEVGPGNVLTGLATRTVDATVTPWSVTVPTDALLEVA